MLLAGQWTHDSKAATGILALYGYFSHRLLVKICTTAV